MCVEKTGVKAGSPVLQFCLGLTGPPRAPRLYVNLRSEASFVVILDLN